MKEKTGGELIRPNATRFGTVFVFLQSCWDRKDKFKEWMVLEEWANNEWVVEADYDYTYDNLTSRSWWGQLKWVLDACKPLLYVLQYADPQKNATLSGFLQRISHARQELESHFGNASEEEKLVLEKINKRIVTLLDIGFMHAAGALDPETHYKHSNFATHHAYTKALTLAIQKMARKNQEEVAAAIGQFLLFRNKRNMFGSRAAVIGASTLLAGD